MNAVLEIVRSVGATTLSAVRRCGALGLFAMRGVYAALTLPQYPTQLARQEEKGGLRAFMQTFAQTQSAFFARAQAGWIDIVEGQGFDGAASVIADLAAGRADPRAGHIIRL